MARSKEELKEILKDNGFNVKLDQKVNVSTTKDSKWMLKNILEGNIDPSNLETEERRACVLRLVTSSLTQAQMADIFKVSRSTISKDLRIVKTRIGRNIEDMDISEILGDLHSSMEVCYSGASGKGDYNTAWKIKKEFFQLLQDLGIAHKEPEKHVFSIEALEDRYEEGRDIMVEAMNPSLTGEVVNNKEEDSIEEADFEVEESEEDNDD